MRLWKVVKIRGSWTIPQGGSPLFPQTSATASLRILYNLERIQRFDRPYEYDS